MRQIADIIGRVTAHSAGPDLVLVAISSTSRARLFYRRLAVLHPEREAD